ncbi:MAG: response regulator [Colwellia sp.]|nr:response regulator [Colwellia sp.]
MLIANIKHRYFNSTFFYLSIFALLYYLAAYVGASLFSLKPSNITLIWLPSGLSLVMFIKWGYKAAPFVIFADFIANFPGMYTEDSVAMSVLHTSLSVAADLFSPIVGMILLRKFLKNGVEIATDLFIFGLCACLIPISISSFMIATNLLSGNYIESSEYIGLIRVLFFADSLGVVLIYQIYIGWEASKSSKNENSNWFIYTTLCISVLLLFGITYLPWVLYLIVPLLIISAFKSNQLNVGILSSLTMLIILVATAHELGPFVSENQLVTNSEAITFVFAIALTLFGVSLQNTQLHRSETNQERLQKATDIAQRKYVDSLQNAILLRDNYTKELEEGIYGATAKIQEKTEKLELLDQQKSLFFTNISHEFRTPLTLIQEPIRKLAAGEYGKLTEKGEEAIEISSRNIASLSRLINELLLLAELDAGASILKASEQDISQFCCRTASLFTHTAADKHINFNCDFPKQEIPLYFDLPKLEKVITNLLSNAFKYTPKGGDVGFAIHAVDEDTKDTGNFLTIVVEDSGTGIVKDEQTHVFERFYRTKSTNDSGVEGSGIGLAIVKELMELHGGTVNVKSKSTGPGSIFTLSLPYGSDHLTTQEVLIKTVPSNSLTIVNSDKTFKDERYTVLVVEDNPDMRTFIVQQLDEKFSIREAEDGLHALEILKTQKVDLVLSDVMMPKMDGISLLNHIRSNQQFKNMPMIMLTAKASEEDRLLALHAKADDFLSKPFNSNELTLKVTNLLARSYLQYPAIMKTNGEKIIRIQTEQYDNEFLKKVRDCVHENIEIVEFDINTLAAKLFMSRSTLQRKIEQASYLTAAQFVRKIRLEKAHYYIQSETHRTLAETAYAVGFSHAGYFSKLYKKYCAEQVTPL